MLESPAYLPLLVIPEGGIQSVVSPRLAENMLAPYETAWSLAAKTAAVNALTAFEVSKIFGISSKIKYPLIHGGAPRAIKLLGKNLNLSNDQINRAFIDGKLKVLRPIMSELLRFCPACVRKGHHFVIHQLTPFSWCPFHDLPLRFHCIRCGNLLLYQLGDSNVRGPINCTECGASLLPVGRGGYPKMTPMSDKKSKALTRWMTFLTNRPIDTLLRKTAGVLRVDQSKNNQFRKRIQVIRLPNSLDKKLLSSVIGAWSCSAHYRCLEMCYWECVNQHWRQCHPLSKHWYRKLVIGLPVDSAPSPQILAFLYWRMTWQGCTNPHLLRRSFAVPMYGIAEWEAQQCVSDDIDKHLAAFGQSLDASWHDWMGYIDVFNVTDLDWITWEMRCRPRAFLNLK